jgi:hypothetical protein
VQIAIITTPRTPSYLEETFAQIDRSSPKDITIDLFSDDPEERPLGLPARMHWMPKSLWRRAFGQKRAKRACLNFLSALMSGVGDLVIFEDDVAVKPDWHHMLSGIRDAAGVEAVSLYWPSEDALEPDTWSHLGYGWRHYRRPVTFHGSLGLWLSGRARVDLTRFIQTLVLFDDADLRELLPFDNCVAAWLNEGVLFSSLPQPFLVAAVPALVDHAGEVSVIPENQDHGARRCPGF